MQNDFSRDVLITIDTNQDNSNLMRFMTRGKLLEENGLRVLEYDESCLEGFEDCVSRIVFDGARVTMIRSGSVNSRMEFEEKKPYCSVLRIPELSVAIDFLPQRVEYDVADSSGWLNLKYDMDIMGNHAINELSLKYEASNE